MSYVVRAKTSFATFEQTFLTIDAANDKASYLKEIGWVDVTVSESESVDMESYLSSLNEMLDNIQDAVDEGLDNDSLSRITYH